MRPRERLLRQGASSLAAVELIAVLLTSGGAKGQSETMLAAALLHRFGGLEQLAGADPRLMARVRGVGAARAAQLCAAFELARRLALPGRSRQPVYSGAEDVFHDFHPRSFRLRRECFWVVLVDRRHKKLSEHLVSVGSLSSTSAEPREVFGPAIRAAAAAVILVHNHPSGDATPSATDCRLTLHLARAGRLLGIEVLDHVVIGASSYTSLKQFCVHVAGHETCPESLPEPIPVMRSSRIHERREDPPSGGWHRRPALVR